jgi:hypothetical protein
MKYILIIPCLLLCSCPFEEEAEPENAPLSSPSSVAVPSSSSVELIEPSILDCPPKDIAEYPVLEEPNPTPLSPSDDKLDGGCNAPPKLSVEELPFGKQGGIRCITTSRAFFDAFPAYGEGNPEQGCHTEYIETFTRIFKKLICPWFTVTMADDDRRTLHISVNQNETGNERKTYVGMSVGNCTAAFPITQSPN